MRIGLDVAQTCVERHGCGWLADRIANAISETCAADQIILYHQFGNWINWDTSKGTVLERPNVFSPFAGSTWLSGKVAWMRIQQGRAELPGCPDLVHSHSFQAPCLGKTPLVYTVHDMSFWIHPEFTTETNRLSCQRGMLDAIRRAAGLIFVSENSLKDFLRLVPNILTRRKLPVAVVLQGPRFVPVAKPRTGFAGQYWLSVGALEPRKNVDLLLDAFELYCKRSKAPRPLHLAGGKGWKSEHTWRRINKMQLTGMVVHYGYVHDNKLRLLYEAA
ncbi:MAG: glycosyltransferase, partial [Verrucomicrobia bacterium]|nr:glycosyltransferase [Verrucomicrobiota bacterium]